MTDAESLKVDLIDSLAPMPPAVNAGYSFCIITNGKRPRKLAKEIESIVSLKIPRFEILLAGEPPVGFSHPSVRVFDCVDAARNGRLGEMRNTLCRAAQYNHLVVADDDLIFHSDFYSGLATYGEDYDVLCVRLLNPDGTRHWDWATHGGPTGHHLLPYNDVAPQVYVTGGFCVMKAEVFRSVQWDEGRGFYQGEDLDFSGRLRQAGFRIRFCVHSTVTHDDPSYSQVGSVIVRRQVAIPIPVALDVSVLGLGHSDPRARTGIYRFVASLFDQLTSRTDIRLTLVSHEKVIAGSRAYVHSKQNVMGSFEVLKLASAPEGALLHSPFFALPSSPIAGPRVLTVYDLISINFPHYFEIGASDAMRKTIASVGSEDFVTVISQATKADLLAYAPHIPSDQIMVTPLAADPRIFYPCKDLQAKNRVLNDLGIGTSTPYLLSVATLEPRKNIAHLIRAFVNLIKEDPANDLKLVLVGTKGWKFDAIFDELSLAGGMRDRIIVTGFVPDEDMAALYSNALAFVYPSLYEGFGLPPLEAMQCGTPVITSDNSSLPEVVGDAGLMVTAHDESQLVEAIRSLCADPQLREAYSKKGLARATTFTWERCVDQTIGAYKMAFERWKTHAMTDSTRASETTSIVIDGVFFQRYQSGVARVWRSLLREWAGTEFGQRLLVLDRGKTAPRFEGLQYLDIPVHDFANMDADRAMLQRVCDEHNAALFISTQHTSPLTTPAVFMAHDMIPELSGLDFVNKPHWRERHVAIRYARHFLAVSKNTAKDLRNYYPEISAEQVTISHCGVDFKASPSSVIENFRRLHGIYKPYYLLVGDGVGYKNAILFFKAFATLGMARSRFDIACTGNTQQLNPEFSQHVGPASVFMLFLSDEDLQTAYAGAHALIYPSKYEGFGMPVIEAMACDCPVITTRNGSLLEVAGDAAIYVDPEDVGSMKRALKQLNDKSYRNRFVAAGRRRASLYSWSRMADIVRTTLTDVAGKAGLAAAPSIPTRDQALAVALEHHQTGKLEQAIPIYLRLLSQDIDDFVATHLLGVARLQQGDIQQATRLLEKAIRLNQLTPEAHYNLGNAYQAQDRLIEAQACWKQALTLNPQFQLARDRLEEIGKAVSGA